MAAGPVAADSRNRQLAPGWASRGWEDPRGGPIQRTSSSPPGARAMGQVYTPPFR
jgi:hypothetical protein